MKILVLVPACGPEGCNSTDVLQGLPQVLNNGSISTYRVEMSTKLTDAPSCVTTVMDMTRSVQVRRLLVPRGDADVAMFEMEEMELVFAIRVINEKNFEVLLISEVMEADECEGDMFICTEYELHSEGDFDF